MLPVTALLPLETLPSWPAVPEPTVLEILMLTLFIPMGIAVVLMALILAPGWRTKSD